MVDTSSQRLTLSTLKALSQDKSVLEGEWKDEGACWLIEPSQAQDFFSEITAAKWRAKKICNGCGVRLECLTFAIVHHQSKGVWGGKTPSERKNIAKRIQHAGYTLEDWDI